MKPRKNNLPLLSERIEASLAAKAERVRKNGGSVLEIFREHSPEGLSQRDFESFLPDDVDRGARNSMTRTRGVAAKFALETDGITRAEVNGESVTLIARTTLEKMVEKYRAFGFKASNDGMGAESLRIIELILANTYPVAENPGFGLEPALGLRPGALLGDCLEYSHSAADIPSAHAASL
jgi:hypothetical protein